jgi:hypothetical protein
MEDLEDWRATGLERDSVVVVDEAGMVGTRQLAALLTKVEHAGAKAVLVGDDKQLPEIAAGGAFRALKDKLPAVELSEVRRQKQSWERDALELLREGRSTEAVEVYGDRGRLVVGQDAVETRALLVADWWAASQQGSAVMVAARKADVTDLNDRARAVLKADGVLGSEEMTVGARSYSVGDEVMTLRNDRRLGVINGSRGVVEAIDDAALQMIVRLEDERQVTLPKDYLEGGSVAHAYAITGHKAQGMTTDRALVLGDESMYREWGYVAMSRGREENRLYVVMGEGSGRDETGGAVERPYELDQLIRSLGRSKAKSLASDPHTDLVELDTASLRREQQQIYERLSQGPRDRTEELSHLRDETEHIQDLIHGERRSAVDAQKRLDGMGAIAKARRRLEVDELRDRITDAGKAEERLSSKLHGMAKEEKELIRAQKDREHWMADHVPLADRSQQIESELSHRDRALLCDRENDLPKYLESAVGEVPERPSEKLEWRKTVLMVEQYREKYEIKDQNRIFGREPRGLAQRLEKERVERTLEERNERRLGLSREDGVGMELSR